MTAFDSVLPRLLPAGFVTHTPARWRESVERFLGLTAARELCEPEPDSAIPIESRVLSKLAIACRVSERDLIQIPKSGAVLAIANHPFGILDGLLISKLLKQIRPDVRFLANGLLAAIPEARELVIAVDPDGGRHNSTALRKGIDFLLQGGCLVVFPAGEVSHFRWKNRAITDGKWNTAAVRLVEIAARHDVPVSTIPIHIDGVNSRLFQAAGMLHPSLRTLLLVRELLNKRKRTIDVQIGSSIGSKKLLEIPSAVERTEYLRWRSDLLSNRPVFKALTSRPLRTKQNGPAADVAGASDPRLMNNEITRLTPLTTSGDLDCFLARSADIPETLREIGRLREITFREAGEGTGKPIDIDRFDRHYLHLFLWNRSAREVVGAYRLATIDMTRDLYTATLFRYGSAFLEKLGPGIELGRSFIRPEYQRNFAPLLTLWKGIGKFVAAHPECRVLFGPVSISNRYQAISRELMVTFLERHLTLGDWVNLIRCRAPFRKNDAILPQARFDLEELSNAISDVEPDRAGIPVLLRQYLRLGGKLIGFNVDPEFSNALDGLILVDLKRTDRKLLDRYLGKTEATRFLEFQKGQNDTQ